MIDFKKELNDEQYRVVTEGDGHCLVLAGAGSGKTRAITYRVAYLIEQGIQPEEILLVTFTNKAAREMVERVQHLTGGETRLPWSGTFHHICYRILRQYAPLTGYRSNFTILDTEDSRDLIKLSVKQEGIDRTQKRFPSPAVIQSLISYSRNASKSMEEVLDEKHPQWLDVVETITRIASEYARRKMEANAMDFDDLLVNTYVLLSRSETVRLKFSEQFKYVLVDEYQDTNSIQASLIKLFSSMHRNLLVVGDDAQSIYSFRAADIQNILDFTYYYSDAKIFKLEINYRSTPEILTLANEIISNNEKQYKKELKSHRDNHVKPELHAFADGQEEAEFIAQRILELRDEGVPLKEMAVLFRASHHSQVLEMELTKRDIPYDYRGGVRFFERAHVKDVLAYLRIFQNNTDTIAWSRVLNMQSGIGPATVESIIHKIIKQTGGNLLHTTDTDEVYENRMTTDVLGIFGESLSARAKIGWKEFLSIWADMVRIKTSEPAQLIRAVMNSGYATYLEAEYPDYRERLEDIEQLAVFGERQPDLQRFLADASLQESFSTPVGKKAAEDEEQVVLSTIHQAKGLEWTAVFIIHLINGQFPNERALREANGVEEERRLFYVAVTRAKTYLHLSYPLIGGFDTMMQGPSIFVEEVSRDLLDEHHLGGSTVFTDPSDDEDDIQYISEDEPFASKPRKAGGFLSSIDDL